MYKCACVLLFMGVLGSMFRCHVVSTESPSPPSLPLHTQTENCFISECLAPKAAGTTKKGGKALRHYY